MYTLCGQRSYTLVFPHIPRPVINGIGTTQVGSLALRLQLPVEAIMLLFSQAFPCTKFAHLKPASDAMLTLVECWDMMTDEVGMFRV